MTLVRLAFGEGARYDNGMVVQTPFRRYVMAVERVERLLADVARCLNAAGIDYAIVGGNAVAAWVASVDDAAVRATKDVDILLRRGDLGRTSEALCAIDLMPIEVLGVRMFVDRRNPNPRTDVHVVIAGECIRPEYQHPAPDPSQSTMFPPEHRVVDLPALVGMKLQSFQFIDRAHIQDLRSVELISDALRASLPVDLAARLREIEAAEE